MISPLHLARHRQKSNETRSYATDADFQELSTREMTDFFQLSFQLTGDTNKAERCLTLATKDCFGTSTILKGFARTWARRMVIKRAIQLVLGINNEFARDAESEFHLQPNRYPIEVLRESVAILALHRIRSPGFCDLRPGTSFDPGLRVAPNEISEGCERCNRAGNESNRLTPRSQRYRNNHNRVRSARDIAVEGTRDENVHLLD